MSIKTKRWNDPKDNDDGWRLLVCRFRPRAVLKKDETWDTWYKELGPSEELHAEYYGKTGTPIPWEQFRERYLEEMKAYDESLEELAKIVSEGKTITLLCSSACADASHCHRTILQQLIEAKLASMAAAPVGASVG